jgi:hypothetical protein
MTDRRYDVLGLDVLVTCEDDEAACALDELLHPFAVTAPVDGRPRCLFDLTVDGSGGRVLERHGELVARDASWERVLAALLVALNREAIDAYAGFATHAGCVAAGQAVIAFPGVSGAGKTTLTAACLLRGLDYVSDEALCVPPSATGVAPYGRPLALTRSAWTLLARGDLGEAGLDAGDGESVVTPSRIGARIAAGELQLAHVVELRRRVGRPRLLPLPRQRGLASLLSMSFNHFKHPRQSFEVASSLAAGSSSWRLDYSDPLEAAALLQAELVA